MSRVVTCWIGSNASKVLRFAGLAQLVVRLTQRCLASQPLGAIGPLLGPAPNAVKFTSHVPRRYLFRKQKYLFRWMHKTSPSMGKPAVATQTE